MKKLIFGILLFTYFTALSADNDWNFTGQIQLRSEIDGRDFFDKSRALNYTSMRTRLSVTNNFFENLNFFVQIQDSRIFGSVPNTLSSINNLDIHQANVTIKEPLGIPISVKAGRFELNYGTQRFIGPVGWHYVGRSFDGAVLNYNPGVNIDVFALTTYNGQKYIANPVPALYPDTLLPSNTSSIYGFWSKKDFEKSHVFDLFGYYEINRLKTLNGNPALSLGTLGLNYNGIFGNFSTIFEAAYQIGSMSNLDVSAYLVSLQGNYKAGSFSFGAGADILSGTEPDETKKYNTFAVSYGTNHKFYGYMDYFINIPLNTNQLGLRDFYALAKWIPVDTDFNFGADFHMFTSDKKFSGDKSSFGNEIDLTVNYKVNKGTTITWGGSVFMPGELMKLMFSTQKNTKEDTAFWTYLMIQANL